MSYPQSATAPAPRPRVTLIGSVVLGVAGLWYFEYGSPSRPVLAQKATMPTQAAGRGFTVSVPAGFAVVKDDRFKQVIDAGGVILVSAEGAAAPASGAPGFRASIVVVPIPAPMQGDLAAVALCRQMAEGSATNAGAAVTSRKIVAASWGPACQYELLDRSQPNRGAIGTLVYRNTAGWMITCNLDPKDERARAACNEVLRSWRFNG